jgi:hypothetical protein
MKKVGLWPASENDQTGGHILAIIDYKYDDLFNPVIAALRQLGGSGTNEEINEKVAEI